MNIESYYIIINHFSIDKIYTHYDCYIYINIFTNTLQTNIGQLYGGNNYLFVYIKSPVNSPKIPRLILDLIVITLYRDKVVYRL